MDRLNFSLSNQLFSKRSASQMGTFTFFDNFNRANEDLSASANWTKASGTGTITVASNSVSMNDTNATGTLYLSPDLGRSDMYVEFDLLTVANTGGPFVILRGSDIDNWVGIRNTTTSLQVYKKVTGTLSFVAGSSGLEANDHIRIELKGTTCNVYVNGALAVGPVTISENSTNTRAGFVSRFAAVANWVDNFKQGVL